MRLPARPNAGARRASWRGRLWACAVVAIAVALAACGTGEGAPNASTDASGGPTDRSPAAAGGTPLPPAASDGSHLSFDGADDRVLMPWDASFPTEVFTVSASIRLAAPPPGRAAIIARGEDDESFNLSWQLFVGPEGNLEAMLEASNEDNYCYPNNDCVPVGTCESGDLFVADGAWHQVALTRDQIGTLVFYIDGEERARCERTGVPSSNNSQFLSFGATHGSIGRLPAGEKEPPIWFLSGEIDDPAMWNISLTPAEIEAVFQEGVDPNSRGLVGFWNLDEGQGQEVNDLSPVILTAQFDAIEEPFDESDATSLADRVACNERQILEEALRQNGNNRTATARSLGISRVGLYKKMRKHGMLEASLGKNGRIAR